MQLNQKTSIGILYVSTAFGSIRSRREAFMAPEVRANWIFEKTWDSILTTPAYCGLSGNLLARIISTLDTFRSEPIRKLYSIERWFLKGRRSTWAWPQKVYWKLFL